VGHAGADEVGCSDAPVTRSRRFDAAPVPGPSIPSPVTAMSAGTAAEQFGGFLARGRLAAAARGVVSPALARHGIRFDAPALGGVVR
jgi:hypothetical protein